MVGFSASQTGQSEVGEASVLDTLVIVEWYASDLNPSANGRLPTGERRDDREARLRLDRGVQRYRNAGDQHRRPLRRMTEVPQDGPHGGPGSNPSDHRRPRASPPRDTDLDPDPGRKGRGAEGEIFRDRSRAAGPL